jgi:dodecin
MPRRGASKCFSLAREDARRSGGKSLELESVVRQEGRHEEEGMADAVYKVVELIGTSTKSWEDAAKTAVERAAKTLRDLRIASVVEQDMTIDKGKVEHYRTKLKVSFKYEGGD